MTKVNEATTLIAQSLEKLKYLVSICDGEYERCPEAEESINLLEQALEKLVENA